MDKQEAMEVVLNHKVYIMGQSQFNRYIPFEIVEHIIEKLDTQEVQNVVIPRYVSTWISHCKAKGLSVVEVFGLKSSTRKNLFKDFPEDIDKCIYWAEKHQDIFIRAWLDGYEVEKEKLYTVEIPNANEDEYVIVLERERGKIRINKSWETSPIWKMGYSKRLTEEEIKKDFAWAWEFAEPVKM